MQLICDAKVPLQASCRRLQKGLDLQKPRGINSPAAQAWSRAHFSRQAQAGQPL